MKFYITFLLGFMTIQCFHCLICYKNQSLTLTKSQINSNNVSEIFTKIPSTNQTVNKSSCHVRLVVNSKRSENDYSQIDFESVSTNHLNASIDFSTTLTFSGNKIQSIISYLDYRCSSKDLCERHFLVKRAIPLLRDFEQPLYTNLLALWKNSTNTPFICDSKIRRENCPSYICFVIYEELKNLTNSKSSCQDLASRSPVNIFVRTLLVSSTRKTVEHQYRCMKNECTGHMMFDSIPTSNYYHSLFGNQTNIDDSAETNQLILQRVLFIVGILLIIAVIAYYIQCRNYRQGYRRTITV